MTSSGTKKKKGRPAVGAGTQVQVRLQPDQLAKLDAWIEANDKSLSRPAAIRAVLEKAL